MIKRVSYNPKIDTGAVVQQIEPTASLPYFTIEDGSFRYPMNDRTRVYGLGEQVRGINKRGWIYRSYCTDEPFHTEDKSSLYGAHNFILIDDGAVRFGAFFDYPTRITFDIGYTDPAMLTVTPETMELELYIIEGDTPTEIVRRFRSLIGRSYIPPLWAFGYGQSRWGYADRDDIRSVADSYRDAHIPMDMIYLDIDYLDNFKDFTVSPERFDRFPSFVSEMKERGLRLIPIIDAAVKREEGYRVYDEGHARGYFCKGRDGEDYIVGVWPGMSVLPDFLNDDAAAWFGSQYRTLTEMGIEGFWNDMNEPALFYSEQGLKEAFAALHTYEDTELNAFTCFRARETLNRLANSDDDYQSFYHRTPAGSIRHSEVHNLYGYRMTKSAADALKECRPGQRSLLFSRASYIGMHRYAGIWTGDNHSWWSHILLLLRQLPSMNMCGFLYTGCDLGGFNGNCTRDLQLRWMSLGVFTPLMRNHAAAGTRSQEAVAFGDTEAFRHIIELRYRLIPYLYSEYMKATLRDEMLFRPLVFDYPDDSRAVEIEDQLMLGSSLMIAPVYVQNADGRMVYLPEPMTMVRMHEDYISTEELSSGDHYIPVPLGDVVFFIRSGALMPLADAAMTTAEIDLDSIVLLGTGRAYELYADDGISPDISEKNITILRQHDAAPRPAF